MKGRKKARPRGGARSRSPRGSAAGQRRGLDALGVAELLVWALLLVVPWLVLPGTRDAFRAPKLLAAEWLALASLVPLAWAWIRQGGEAADGARALRRSPAVRLLAPLLLVATAGWMFTSYRPVVARALADLWIAAVVLVGWSLAFPRHRLRRFLSGLMIPGVFLAILAVLQFHGWFRPFLFLGGQEEGRLGVTSLAGNPGDLAGFLVLVAVVAQSELLRRRGKARWWTGAALALVLYALLLTQTLGALAAVLAASLALWAVVLPRRWTIGGAAFVAAALVVLVLATPPLRQRVEGIREMVAAGRINAALTGRLDAWRVAARMFVDEPWTGVGHGAYESAFAPTKLELVDEGVKFYRGLTTVNFANAHNELLEVAAEWGVPGLLALLWAATIVTGRVRRFRRRAGEAREPPDRGLALGGLVGLAVVALVHFPFRLAITAYPALLLLAWLLADEGGPAAGSGAEETVKGAKHGGRRRRNLLAVVLLGVLVLGLGLQTRRALHQLRAEGLLWRVERDSQAMLAAGRLNATVLWAQIGLLEEASRLEPAQAAHHLARGSQYLLLRRSAEAIGAYHEALALEPRPETYLNLGRAQQQAGRDEEARESFLTAVKLDPYLREQVPEEYRGDLPRRGELVED